MLLLSVPFTFTTGARQLLNLVSSRLLTALLGGTALACWRGLRALHPEDAPYTYWDYGPAFESNRGLRIDHALLSPDLAERLTRAGLRVVLEAETARSVDSTRSTFAACVTFCTPVRRASGTSLYVAGV